MRRPHILILLTDQQRWDALGSNGNRDIRTPNLDRLAAVGVNFEHCFVQNPVCVPSRVSLLTGQYPGTLGITRMGAPVPPATMTLPRLLRLQGRSLAGVLAGVAGAETGRDAAPMEHTGWKTMRTPQFRYHVEAHRREVLFDLATNPGEYRDVADQPAYTATLAALRRRLLQRLLTRERPLPRTWTYSDDGVVVCRYEAD